MDGREQAGHERGQAGQERGASSAGGAVVARLSEQNEECLSIIARALPPGSHTHSLSHTHTHTRAHTHTHM